MLDQEREHLDTFIHLMGERQARPTIIAPIWSAAGFAAGAATALAGEKMAMALTSAVEEVITEHYNDQIREVHELGLRETEAPLRKLLVQFRDDEAEHRATAIHHHALEAPFYEAFSRLVKAGCLTAIFVAERV
jgi:ubiquinone biosynthesis monooxygenase Coq7